MELLKLVRELRARAELLEDDDWSGGGRRPERPEAAAGREVRSDTVPAALTALCRKVVACRKCHLGSQRLNPAFGVGSPEAGVMFVGEGPGFEEDRKGEPFVGKAGQLLDRILAAVELSRAAVYIANIVKCHPMVDPSMPDKRSNDRPPTPGEMDACRGYLDEQVRLIAPRFIVTLGASASKALLRTETGITRLRGKWYDYRDGIRLLPTYHPAALLRNPDLKRDVWTDMKSLRAALETLP